MAMLPSKTVERKASQTQDEARKEQDDVDWCQVCGLPTECKNPAGDSQTALPVCQACKKFFQRNRNREEESMRCISGTSNCKIGKSTAEPIATGVVWRKVCPRCRLAKCNAIGMQHSYRDIWPVIASLPLRSSPERFECSAAEEALKKTAEASSEFAASFSKLPLKINEKKFRNEMDCWQNTMQHFEYVTKTVSTFIKSMPGYNELPVQDRCVHFSNSILPITLAEANRNSSTPGAMSARNAEQLYGYFPEYNYVKQEANHLWSAIRSWGPSVTEFSCLLAVLFYKNLFVKSSSEAFHVGSGTSGEIADLELAIRSLVMQQCGGDDFTFNQRIQQFIHVVDNLRASVPRRQAASAAVARRCPHLFQMNALHSAVYREYCKTNSSSSTATSNTASPTRASSGIPPSYGSASTGSTPSTSSASSSLNSSFSPSQTSRHSESINADSAIIRGLVRDEHPCYRITRLSARSDRSDN